MRVLELTENPGFYGGPSSVSPEDPISSQGKSETQPDSVEGPAQGAGPARTTLRAPRSLVLASRGYTSVSNRTAHVELT